MKTAIFLSVRNKATRLPNKHLLKINGRTTIEHLIDRIRLAKKPGMIVLCTSTNNDDKILADIAEKNGIACFRGSEDDKLDRYLKAARKFDIDFMAIVDGDDIFCDPAYIDMAIGEFEKNSFDFVYCEGLPVGAAPTGIRLSALEEVCRTKGMADTEVWGNYFLKNANFKKRKITAWKEVNFPEIRMTLDYREDFDFFERVFRELGPKNTFSLHDIISLLQKKPEIMAINSEKQKEYEMIIKIKAGKVLSDIK